jgi:hypothetical protein
MTPAPLPSLVPRLIAHARREPCRHLAPRSALGPRPHPACRRTRFVLKIQLITFRQLLILISPGLRVRDNNARSKAKRFTTSRAHNFRSPLRIVRPSSLAPGSDLQPADHHQGRPDPDGPPPVRKTETLAATPPSAEKKRRPRPRMTRCPRIMPRLRWG